MFKKIAIAVVVVVAAVLLFAATRPDTFQVQRATGIKAAPEKIFPYINDLRRFSAWSPYENKDPNMKRTYSGADSGKGAVYAWEGNREVGEGQLSITDSAAPGKVSMQLDFEKPFEAHNRVEFTLVPKGEMTEVSWNMHGPNHYVGKVVHLFVDMDHMVGKDFEAGLANLKSLVEKEAAAAAK